ncbi:EAL domain-containing protein [Labrys wisconsinensis]|uniref:Cyclic-di-GMP phosphodiesterase TipF (Flagellum assembly factor) n=1 Tax=Labrys wisconsinensis TaxID=425677 RepID=A0ABU0JKZ6_9HYPH|nr:EAL domain-containing protein [Labrys wisconsinensis]MDQ0474965.1 cyclic-di-GMP phosphodiesterase TipF (flagellum assembly factor) [Labrys wisconsinensis]
MSRLASLLLPLCMALIAMGIAAGLFAGGQTPAWLAAAIGIGLFSLAMVTRQAVAARDRRLVQTVMAKADHASHGVMRRRLEQVEARLKVLELAVSRGAGPSAEEIAALGALVKDLAESQAVQETRLGTLAELMTRAVERFAPAQPDAEAPEPAASTPRPAIPDPPVFAPPPRPVVPAPPVFAPARLAPAPQPSAPRQQLEEPDLETVEPEEPEPVDPAFLRALAEAVEAGRIEAHLQPVVTLPQRKPRLYEALPRIRLADGRLLAQPEFMPALEALGRAGAFDRHQFLHGRQIVRRLASRNRELALVVNLSPRSLTDRPFLDEAAAFARSAPELVPQLVFELGQSAFEALDETQAARLRGLAAVGYRLSMDETHDLRFDPQALAERGIRFVKVPAAALLAQAEAGLGIRVEDLAGLLARHGLELIADGVDSEATVVDLLDFDLRLGQGDVFAPPRPVRADLAAEEPKPPDAAPPDPGPRTLGEAALYRAIDRFREKAADPPAAEPPRPSAWRLLARRVTAQERTGLPASAPVSAGPGRNP